MQKKSLALGVVAVSAVAIGFFATTGMTKAATEVGRYPTVIENIASKFNLNTDEVEKVFEDTRTQMQTERLDRMVEEGVITQEQISLITKKQEEYKAKLDEINSNTATTEERRDAMHELNEEMRDWAEENDIPAGAVKGGPMGKGRGGRMGGNGFGGNGMGCLDN